VRYGNRKEIFKNLPRMPAEIGVPTDHPLGSSRRVQERAARRAAAASTRTRSSAHSEEAIGCEDHVPRVLNANVRIENNSAVK